MLEWVVVFLMSATIAGMMWYERRHPNSVGTVLLAIPHGP